MTIRYERVVSWMNVIRNTQGKQQYRILENFWESQLKSKLWLLEIIKNLSIIPTGNVYIFGGWYGILSQLIVDSFGEVTAVYNIDVDDDCRQYGNLLSNNDYKIHFHTIDMKDFVKYETPSLIINTSTEHITDDVFTTWLANVPKNIPIILQGNDFFHCEDHIRCSTDLEDFKKMNSLTHYLFEGQIYCPGNFYRFMTVGFK